MCSHCWTTWQKVTVMLDVIVELCQDSSDAVRSGRRGEKQNEVRDLYKDEEPPHLERRVELCVGAGSWGGFQTLHDKSEETLVLPTYFRC